jgi:hypothetical protein
MLTDLVVHALALLSTVALGLAAGALVAEGGVLVPFWRSERPEAFLAWYRDHAALLVGFYGPLEIAAVGLAATALVANWLHPVMAAGPLLGAAVLAFGVLVAFPLYFQKANISFAAGTIELARVPDELRRWSRWHWARTALALGAFICAVVAPRS